MWGKVSNPSLQHGANGLADGGGVDLVVRGQPEGEVADPAPGAVYQDDLTWLQVLGDAEQLVLRTVRGEAYPLDPPLLLLALRVVRPVGGGGVGRQYHGVLRALLQALAVEGASPALHRYRGGDDGARVREDTFARAVVVGDGPDVLGEE